MLTKKEILSLSPRSIHNPLYQFLFDIIDKMMLKNYECYYFYSSPFGDGTDCGDLLDIDYKSNLIIFYAEDSLIGSKPYDYYKNKKPYGLEKIEQVCLKYPDKKFILVNIQYYLQTLVTVPNLKCIGLMPIGQIKKENRADLTRCLDKKPSEGLAWVTFNNSPTPSRIAMLSYLLAKRLDEKGRITISDTLIELCLEHNNIIDVSKYAFSKKDGNFLNIGFKKLRTSNIKKQEIAPYENYSRSATCSNYSENLFPIYQRSRLEIITSTSYEVPTPQISEKEMQSVYGCVFPLLISSVYQIQLLRKWGFDMFDDIIDHSYDLVHEPAERFKKAINDNIELLDGRKDLESLWNRSYERFSYNCDIADNLHKTVEKDFLLDFSLALKSYGINFKPVR